MDGLGDFVKEVASGENRRSEFDLYEPWDVKKRSNIIKDLLKKDGVTGKVEDYGDDPHEFQSGIMFGWARLMAIFAGTQVGKSYPVLIDIIIQCTGRIPHAFKFEKGEDTGVKRDITTNNIRRFGRFDNETGLHLDHSEKAEQDGTWDCGNIIGVGLYPKEKLMHPTGEPADSVIWIGTFKQAREENWWKKLKLFIPESCIDKTKGNEGYNNGDYHIYFANGAEIHIITYEQGYERFESVKVFRCVLDEEPPNEKIFTAALTHSHQLTLVETPYRGVTFTWHRIKNASGKIGEAIKFFHCIMYDCPYKTVDEIRVERSTMPKWEIEARVYGLHSEQTGKPYFHDMYDQLSSWCKKFLCTGITYDIQSTTPVCKPEQYATATMRAIPNPEGAWEIYEDPKPEYAYWCSADTARGDETEDERVDANVSHIFRPPDPKKKENPDIPIEVACCRTQAETKVFAREVLAGCSYYNNALMAPEAKGFSAGTFIATVHGWPFMYTMTVQDDRTKKYVERIGFNTNVKTRQQLFDGIGEVLKMNIDSTESPFKSYCVLDEVFKLIVGKGGRPDHSKTSSSDSIISYAIGLHVYEHDRMQIKNNRLYKVKKSQNNVDTWGGRFVQKENNETRKVLGSRRGLDARSR